MPHKHSQTLRNVAGSRVRCPWITFEYCVPICRETNVATCRTSSTSASSSATSTSVEGTMFIPQISYTVVQVCIHNIYL